MLIQPESKTVGIPMGIYLELDLSCVGDLVSCTMNLDGILCKEDFFYSLSKKPPWDYDELLVRTEKYINMEEVQKARLE